MGPWAQASCLITSCQQHVPPASLQIRILKVDTDENQQLATQLQIYGLPTIIFVSTNKDKPALRTEGMLPAETLIEIVEKELLVDTPAQ